MRQVKRVLVATDLSEGSDEALREGARLASRSKWPLGVVHVLASLDPLLGFSSLAHPAAGMDIAALCRHTHEAIRDRVTRLIGCPTAEIFVDEGVADDAIVRRAAQWHADIIVIGSHTRSGLGQAFGGVAERVVRYAHCRVLVARASGHHGGVLAATDLSKPSLPAIVAGDEEARRRTEPLTVVHAVGFFELEARYLFGPRGPSSERESDLAVFASELEGAVAQRGIRARCEILDGPAASAIVREASAIDAELVVVAVGGKTGLGRVAAWSVAAKVARTAPCSVLVVRESPPGSVLTA
jgi:universal stress protein A